MESSLKKEKLKKLKCNSETVISKVDNVKIACYLPHQDLLYRKLPVNDWMTIRHCWAMDLIKEKWLTGSTGRVNIRLKEGFFNSSGKANHCNIFSQNFSNKTCLKRMWEFVRCLPQSWETSLTQKQWSNLGRVSAS